MKHLSGGGPLVNCTYGDHRPVSYSLVNSNVLIIINDSFILQQLNKPDGQGLITTMTDM